MKITKMMITILVVMFAIGIGYASITFFGKDNKLEEGCERVIMKKTGKKIDLSGPDNEKK